MRLLTTRRPVDSGMALTVAPARCTTGCTCVVCRGATTCNRSMTATTGLYEIVLAASDLPDFEFHSEALLHAPHAAVWSRCIAPATRRRSEVLERLAAPA